MRDATDLPISEIVPDPARLFRQLRRVDYETAPAIHEPGLDWPQVAARMARASQAMGVVNAKKDARALFRELPNASRLHLSTAMCGAHRRRVLHQVIDRLKTGQPCHLATTQLVEAGVDIDFPLVLRAIGPLDRVVQAAGRCNREGRASAGTVIIFQPSEGAMPPGAYKTGADTAAAMLRQPDLDLHLPRTYADYFKRLYHGVDLDERHIDRSRSRLQFETVARDYHIIEEDAVPVAVPWSHGEALLNDTERQGPQLTREHLRALQPYFVSLRRWEIERAQALGLCREIVPGLWRWEGVYDNDVGLLLDDQPPTIAF
jgi:CRISPR-associated endonuclease/helicase Cas3